MRSADRPTLRRVAVEAGWSVATASRVFNNQPTSPEAREDILNAAWRLGYALRTKDLIGLIIPDESNDWFTHLGFVFQEQLDKLGAQVIMASSQGRADRELALVNKFKSLGLRGLVYISGGSPPETVLRALADENVPVVLFDRKLQDGNLDFVSVNSREGMIRAVDYLVALGHTRIGHLKGLAGTQTATDRYQSFYDAMSRNRLEVEASWVWEGDYRFASGRACAESLLYGDSDEAPTAIIAANDLMAIGLMQRLQQAGWVIPRDMSIVGFDNIEITQWLHPTLTTVEQPVRELAYHAIDALMSRIRHHELHPDQPLDPRLHEIQPMLIPRDSTAPPRRKEPPEQFDDGQIVPFRRPSDA